MHASLDDLLGSCSRPYTLYTDEAFKFIAGAVLVITFYAIRKAGRKEQKDGLHGLR